MDFKETKSLFINHGKLDMLAYIYKEFKNSEVIHKDAEIFIEIQKIIGKAIDSIQV